MNKVARVIDRIPSTVRGGIRLISACGSFQPVYPKRALAAKALLAVVVAAGVTWGAPLPSNVVQPAFKAQIVYLGKQYAESHSASLLNKHVIGEGFDGARAALIDNNSTGRLLGEEYELAPVMLSPDEDVAATAKTVLTEEGSLIVADLEATDLLAVADLPEARNAIILDVRTSDDALRQRECRANLFHIAPSWSMRADALAQYLRRKNWIRWLLVRGTSEGDLGFARAVRRAADRFAANIVAERGYVANGGSPRSSAGHEIVQDQMSQLTQGAPEHDVVFVVDLEARFGEHLPFNTFDARPVVGTQGLTAVAWDRSFGEYSGSNLQIRFARLAGRDMTERDYTGWLAVRIFGEGVTRAGSNSALVLRHYIRSQKFVVAGYKGVGMTFRHWDLQLRQPILLSGPRALVSVSPQDGYPTDALGFDETETKCRLSL